MVIVLVYCSKSRVMVWRAARCLQPCDRISSPLLVMRVHLIVRVNETRHSCHYSLPAKFKNDRMENCKMPEVL